jgi:hypothetical protein
MELGTIEVRSVPKRAKFNRHWQKNLWERHSGRSTNDWPAGGAKPLETLSHRYRASSLEIISQVLVHNTSLTADMRTSSSQIQTAVVLGST